MAVVVWDTGDRGLFIFYFAVIFSLLYFRIRLLRLLKGDFCIDRR
jgi:hypothetical protein